MKLSRNWSAKALSTLPALMVGLTVAAIGASFGAWLGWCGAPVLPSDSEALGVVKSALQVGDPTAVERRNVLFAYEYSEGGAAEWLVGGDDYNGGVVQLTFDVPGSQLDSEDELEAHLKAAGWRVSRWESVVVAAKDGLGLNAWMDGDGIGVEIERSEPSFVLPLAISGGLLAALLGTIIFRYGAEVTRSNRLRSVSSTLVVVGIVSLAPATVMTLSQIRYSYLVLPEELRPPALWSAYMEYGVRSLVVIGVIAWLAALAVVTVIRLTSLGRQLPREP